MHQLKIHQSLYYDCNAAQAEICLLTSMGYNDASMGKMDQNNTEDNTTRLLPAVDAALTSP